MDDQVADKVKASLAETQWKVTKLDRISGGNANFTYRGHLENGNTIFIKHAEPFAALNQAYALDATRSDYEWLMLEALSDKPAAITGKLQVRTPKVLGSFGTTKIVEDMPNSLTIKAYLSQYGSTIDSKIASDVGAALGNWLAQFHVWLNGDSSQAKEIREKLKSNPLIGPRAELYIGTYMECTKMFPHLQWPTKDEFASIEKYVRDMYSAGQEAIHGDFWTGKYVSRRDFILST